MLPVGELGPAYLCEALDCESWDGTAQMERPVSMATGAAPIVSVCHSSQQCLPWETAQSISSCILLWIQETGWQCCYGYQEFCLRGDPRI